MAGRLGKLGAVLAVAAGCHGGSGKQHREGSAAAVEVVATVPTIAAGGGSAAGAGAVVDEVEPNNDDDVATPLPVGGTARGKLDTDGDVDRYRLDVTQAGMLELALPGIDGTDLVLEVADDTGAVIARSDRGGARVREGVPNLGVTPGRYTAIVRAAPRPARPRGRPGKGGAASEPAAAGPSATYELTARMVPAAAGGEREPDGDRGTANDLLVADVATGFVGWTGDADVWKLSVEALAAQNVLDVDVTAVEGVALELDVAGGIGQPLLARKAPRGAPVAIKGLLPQVPPGGSPFYYLTVRGDKSNPETPYRLTVTAKLLATDAETEPNDTPETAFVLPPDRTIVHATWTPGDVDCFVLGPSDAGAAPLMTIEPPADLDLAATLVVDGKLVASENKAGKGGAEQITGHIPAFARAVVCVRGADPAAVGEGAYEVRLQYSDAAP